MNTPSSSYNTGLIIKALAFAAHKHRDQRRKDVKSSPYINHPIALADVLCNEGGITDENVLCTALLHDTVEDTETTPKELTQVFGKTISGLVMELTDDKTLPKADRKRLQIEHAAHASHHAKLVKLADKISNLQDIVSYPPDGWDIQRKQEYFDGAKAVVDQVRGTNADLEGIFDAIYDKGLGGISS
jgi:GTP diphosphokinase / guanosine-3',5'-bis(diphosphate) 3'-diphosphatase